VYNVPPEKLKDEEIKPANWKLKEGTLIAVTPKSRK